MPLGRSFVLLLLLVWPSACGGGRSYDPRLSALATAPIEAGQGLGDLVLDQTTLNDVLAKYGTGHVSLLAGDDAAFELSFAGGQLDLLFVVPTEWYRDREPVQDAVRDLETFVKARPKYGDLRLASLSIDMRRAVKDPFYKGHLSQGGHLGGPVSDVFEGYGEPKDGPGLFTAGMSPNNSPERAMYVPLGLLVHYRTPEPDVGSKIAAEIESKAEQVRLDTGDALDELRKPALIERITIFVPGRS